MIMSSQWCLLLQILVLVKLSIFIEGNEEVDVLMKFCEGLDVQSIRMESWNASNVNPCAWFSVTCNTDDKTVRLDLGESGMSGTLSPELGKLNMLQYLILYSNNLSGTIPETLGNLTELVALSLQQNKLSGSIPSVLEDLSNLKFLHLSNISVSGEIPMSLTTIHDLEQLDLSSNNLTGPVPSKGSFANFKRDSFEDNPGLCGPIVNKECTVTPSPPDSSAASDLHSFRENLLLSVLVILCTCFSFRGMWPW